MPTLTPTPLAGALTKAVPVVYAEPERYIPDATLAAFMDGSGMNGAFLAEVLSGMLAHERCGRHLYRTCETRTTNEELGGKYTEFGDETERHVEILEELIVEAGGSPMYVGPTARAVLGTDTRLVEATFALGGSLDPLTTELAMLDAVFLAESMDNANWKLFTTLTAKLQDTRWYEPFDAAAVEVAPQEDEHLRWAAETKLRIVMTQAVASAD
jgi:rubrerythrin